MAKAAGAAWRNPKLVDLDKLSACNGRDNELRDTFLRFNRDGVLAEINQDHLHLAAVIGVYRARRIHQREALFERAATSGPHLPFEPGWYFNCNSSRDGGTGEWLKYQRFVERSKQVNSSSVLAMVTWHTSTQALNFYDGNNQ
jgi:hypothetical protein